MAIAGLACGAIALVLIWFSVIGLVVAIAGIGLSVIGLTRADQGHADSKVVAGIGLASAAVATLAWLTFFAVAILS
ncbi:hypothetical protein [Actinokineospora globicatena]|uniref:DUF4190 domain-containing protein n=1 Tax=Actinokineospora globicatena TaxID=103729 RepID=A0A9W6QVP1_9PSEU|nr:hypothetical protein [Actinokineospora globicatena]GLW95407.1 hypothetical protein Aglo03_62230 [Actinokineospora globicatena]